MVLVNFAASLLGPAPWWPISWLQADTSGDDKTRTLATIPRDTCRHITRKYRCYCRTDSLVSSCLRLKDRGTTTSWVSGSINVPVEALHILSHWNNNVVLYVRGSSHGVEHRFSSLLRDSVNLLPSHYYVIMWAYYPCIIMWFCELTTLSLLCDYVSLLPSGPFCLIGTELLVLLDRP